MGLRLAQRANGVSVLHGAVSREMFAGPVAGLRPRRGADQLHHQRRARPHLGRARGHAAGRRSAQRAEDAASAAPTAGRRVAEIPDADVWELRGALREQLVEDVRAAAARRPGGSAAPATAELGWIDDVLDPDVLTIGFARRVPSYKRLTLMLRDPDRLTRAAARPRAADPDRGRGQGAPGRRGRQAADPADRAVRRRPAACGTASSSCPTTTWRMASCSTRAATSG